MAANNEDGTGKIWEGYSDYQRVSQRFAMSIEDAVDAFATLKARHHEEVRVKAIQAASARRHIEGAALRLRVEMEQDRGEKELYAEILDDWEGENGYLQRFGEIRLENSCPSWLDDFVEDIRRAGWHLGYLQAGRSVRTQAEDPAEQEAKSMLHD